MKTNVYAGKKYEKVCANEVQPSPAACGSVACAVNRYIRQNREGGKRFEQKVEVSCRGETTTISAGNARSE